MADNYSTTTTTASSSARRLIAVTPHDSTNLTDVAKALYVGVGGDIAILAPGDSSAVPLVGVPSGTILPIQTKRVDATGTTATSIVALYD